MKKYVIHKQEKKDIVNIIHTYFMKIENINKKIDGKKFYCNIL